MANTIKLKQGSGSDPSASDLVLGEPAIRTDTGEIFLKKDDGSIAKVAGGIEDGDKGDITVSNDGATFTIDNDAVTYAKIQNVSATNRILGRDSSGAGVIEEITPANLRTMINVENGATADQSASEILTLLKTVDGSGSGLDADLLDGQEGTFYRNASNIYAGTLNNARLASTITSNTSGNAATATKLATARTIAGVSFDGSANISLNNNAITNGAGYITATLTNEQVQDIVGGMVTGNTESGITVTYQDGDGTLDFSVASQTDNNFTNADHSKLDGIEAGATADQSASEILTAIKTVDGPSSGLNADLLDNLHAANFLRGDTDDTMSGNLTINGRLDIGDGSGNDTEIRIYKADNNVSDHIQFYNGTTRIGEIGCEDSTWLRINQETNKNIYTPRYIRADNGFFVDGTSKGINGSGNFIGGTIAGASDYSTLLRSDTADTASGDITFSGGAGAATIAANSDISFTNGTWSGNHTKIQHHDNVLYIVGGSNGIFFREGSTDRWQIDGSGHFDPKQDSTYDIGQSNLRVRVGYFDEVDSGEVRVNNGILETKATIATSHSLTSGFNAMAVSPTINSGVTITVPSGAVWAIV